MSPNQGTWLGISWLGLVSLCQIWDFYRYSLNTLKYPKMGICYFSLWLFYNWRNENNIVTLITVQDWCSTYKYSHTRHILGPSYSLTSCFLQFSIKHSHAWRILGLKYSLYIIFEEGTGTAYQLGVFAVKTFLWNLFINTVRCSF